MNERGLTLNVFRPVQYLGSKLRVLSPIVQEVTRRGRNQVIWDAFTGSSVVAQAMAASGHRVVATDTQRASALFATALLGVGRGAPISPREVSYLREHSDDSLNRGAWAPWIQAEQIAIDDSDGAALLEIGQQVPQIWRPGWGESPTAELPSSLLSEVYAGTYFGVSQTLRLESIRRSIELATQDGVLDSWQAASALTALCTAASRAVFSAGKHFAQPHRIAGEKNLSFHSRRIISDRAVDIDALFYSTLDIIERNARPSDEYHEAEWRDVDLVSGEDLARREITTVYADPPYTAQQYSRFYHVLETIVTNDRPPLQQSRGAVTAGLYPVGRYLSPFCSVRQAPGAFRSLFQTASNAGARIVLSYSGSHLSPSATGNARSIALPDLMAIAGESYPSVTVKEVDVEYKQFNRRSAQVAGRHDSEYLIVGED